MIDASTKTVVGSIEVGGGTLTGIAVTPDGSTIFVNQSDANTADQMLFVQLSDWVAAGPDLELALDSDPGLA